MPRVEGPVTVAHFPFIFSLSAFVFELILLTPDSLVFSTLQINGRTRKHLFEQKAEEKHIGGHRV